jgi:hypothetical protein
MTHERLERHGGGAGGGGSASVGDARGVPSSREAAREEAVVLGGASRSEGGGSVASSRAAAGEAEEVLGVMYDAHMHRYAVYLLYRYKSTNTDAAEVLGGDACRAYEQELAVCAPPLRA